MWANKLKGANIEFLEVEEKEEEEKGKELEPFVEQYEKSPRY